MHIVSISMSLFKINMRHIKRRFNNSLAVEVASGRKGSFR